MPHSFIFRGEGPQELEVTTWNNRIALSISDEPNGFNVFSVELNKPDVKRLLLALTEFDNQLKD